MHKEIESLCDYIEFVKEWRLNEERILQENCKLLETNFNGIISGDMPEWLENIKKTDELQYENALVRCKYYLYVEWMKSRSVLNDYRQGKNRVGAFYFRGQYNAKWDVVPSVFREEFAAVEHLLYHEIIVRCPEMFNSLSHLDKLVQMQHYDCPTRLLDLTTNPLIALFFACYNFRCDNCDSVEMGKVFMFRIPQEEVLYSDSDRALILSCLSQLNNDEKRGILESSNECYKEIVETYLESEKHRKSTLNKDFGAYRKVTGGSKYRDKVIEKLHQEISTEKPSFKREMSPFDLIAPKVVKPNKNNSRIIKQDGAFIINGLSYNEEEAGYRIRLIPNEILIIRNKETILDELDKIGINEANLFPEMDKVADYLKKKYKASDLSD